MYAVFGIMVRDTGAKYVLEKLGLSLLQWVLLISHPPAPFPRKGGKTRAAALDLLGATPQTP